MHLRTKSDILHFLAKILFSLVDKLPAIYAQILYIPPPAQVKALNFSPSYTAPPWKNF